MDLISPTDRYISIHLPLRGETILYNQHYEPYLFQSISPYGEKLLVLSKCRIISFQSISPYGEKLSISYESVRIFDFNPSPLTGRNAAETMIADVLMISIHLPLRGETCSFEQQHDLILFQSISPYGEKPVSAL